jgi:hypothetical protein
MSAYDRPISDMGGIRAKTLAPGMAAVSPELDHNLWSRVSVHAIAFDGLSVGDQHNEWLAAEGAEIDYSWRSSLLTARINSSIASIQARRFSEVAMSSRTSISPVCLATAWVVPDFLIMAPGTMEQRCCR